jgi:hypothetical protein
VVLGLPVDVVISVVVPIIGAPIRGKGVLIRVRASRVGVVQRHGALTVHAASDMGDGALVPLVSPGVAETTEFLLVALLSVMADLVAGLAACPGSCVLGALGVNMAAVPAHGAKGVHVVVGGVAGQVGGGMGEAGRTVGSVSREGGVGEEGRMLDAVSKRMEHTMHSTVGWSVSSQIAQGEGEAQRLPLLLYQLLFLRLPPR